LHEFQFPVDQGTGIEKLESLEEREERIGTPELNPRRRGFSAAPRADRLPHARGYCATGREEAITEDGVGRGEQGDDAQQNDKRRHRRQDGVNVIAGSYSNLIAGTSHKFLSVQCSVFSFQ
jgi:hypothetical protein